MELGTHPCPTKLPHSQPHQQPQLGDSRRVPKPPTSLRKPLWQSSGENIVPKARPGPGPGEEKVPRRSAPSCRGRSEGEHVPQDVTASLGTAASQTPLVALPALSVGSPPEPHGIATSKDPPETGEPQGPAPHPRREHEPWQCRGCSLGTLTPCPKQLPLPAPASARSQPRFNGPVQTSRVTAPSGTTPLLSHRT